jgi:tRNA (adenine22-N1)-methyltransferase
MPSLSLRLQAALDAAGPCDLLADVCCDHALLALASVERGVARRAVAVELRAAPLAQARRSLAGSGLSERVLLLRARGLSALRRAEVVVIAGVGGDLAGELLGEAAQAGARRVVVQPNRHGREVRQAAREAGFHLEAERVIDEDRRLHLLLSFTRREGRDPAYGRADDQLELFLGPMLLASADEAARRFVREGGQRLRRLAAHQPALAALARALDRWGH